MLLLSCDHIAKSFGDRKLFSEVNVKVYSGDRIGLVGANGSGKSTLLKILSGLETPDDGQVKAYSRISFITQSDDGVPEVASPLFFQPSEEKLASTLGIRSESLHGNMSGGEKSRARFALQFDHSAGLLFADEPTSNMDMQAAGIIEKELAAFKGALLLVSHDRSILDKLCTNILEISDGKVRTYNGNYSSYLAQREEMYNRQCFEYESYIKEKMRLENRVQERVENSRAVRKAPKRMGNSEARLHRRSATEIQEKLEKSIDAMKTRLEHLEVKEKPSERPLVKISIDPFNNPVSSIAVSAKKLSLGFPGFKLLENASFEIPTRKRTALIGTNGAGKTSLVELIIKNEQERSTMGSQEDHGLRLAPGIKIGYFKQDFSLLRPDQTILENVLSGSSRPEHEVRTILARLLITRDEVYKKAGVLSGGEKVKVSLARILCSDANFLILDEPTNYLDVFSMEAMEKVLCDYNGTLLLISHDRKFVENVGQRLLILENRDMITFEGPLAAYEEEKAKGVEKKQSLTDPSLNIMVLDMRLAELSSRIDSCRDEQTKIKLTQEYFELCRVKNASKR